MICQNFCVTFYHACFEMSSVDHINNFSVNGNEILICFDLVSWFTFMSVVKPLHFVLKLLSGDKSLCLRIFF